MGEVYLANDAVLERPVVLKVSRFDHEELQTRFLREAKLMARVHHSNVCQIYDLCVDSGAAVIVMEYVEGGALDAFLGKFPYRKVPLSVVLRVAEEAALGISGAHTVLRSPVIHRDLKPANVLMDRFETVKVSDFGLAYSKLRSESPLPGSFEPMGTRGYQSPEQLTDPSEVKEPSDIWAFGAMLYEMLAGELPFGQDRQTPARTLKPGAKPPPLARKRSDLPSELCSLVEGCLEQDPAQRPTTMKEIADDLREIAGRLVQGRSHDRIDVGARSLTEITSPDKCVFFDGAALRDLVVRFKGDPCTQRHDHAYLVLALLDAFQRQPKTEKELALSSLQAISRFTELTAGALFDGAQFQDGGENLTLHAARRQILSRQPKSGLYWDQISEQDRRDFASLVAERLQPIIAGLCEQLTLVEPLLSNVHGSDASERAADNAGTPPVFRKHIHRILEVLRRTAIHPGDAAALAAAADFGADVLLTGNRVVCSSRCRETLDELSDCTAVAHTLGLVDWTGSPGADSAAAGGAT